MNQHACTAASICFAGVSLSQINEVVSIVAGVIAAIAGLLSIISWVYKRLNK
jgi:hypothetical protein